MPCSVNAPSFLQSRVELALALVDVDRDRGLSVLLRRELLGLARRDRRVAQDQLGHDAAERLDAERERDHVEQQQRALPPASTSAWIAAPSATARSGSTDVFGDTARDLLQASADERDARRAADQHDVVDPPARPRPRP
jgi:hypothetical protein